MASKNKAGYEERGLLPLDTDQGLETVVHFSSEGKLTGIDLLRMKPLACVSDPMPTPALKALHLCMQPGTTVSVNGAWDEFKVSRRGKTVWRVGLACELSPFRRRVYGALLAIGARETISYGGLAKLAQSAPRAVGQAMARNFLPILVPCHRVIAADGGPGGFGSPEGVMIKQRMLKYEMESGF